MHENINYIFLAWYSGNIASALGFALSTSENGVKEGLVDWCCDCFVPYAANYSSSGCHPWVGSSFFFFFLMSPPELLVFISFSALPY